MSDPVEELARLAEEERKAQAEALGANPGLDQWSDSLPEARIPERGALDIYLESSKMEEAALTQGFSPVAQGDTGTTPPISGPDDEGTRPDAPGDTSEGDTETPAPPTPEEILVNMEGLWQPPPEAEAENYIEPTTDEMVGTQEWVDNSRVLWEAFGSPNTNQDFVSGSGNFGSWQVVDGVMGGPAPNMTDEDIAAWSKELMSGFNWNLVSLSATAAKITSMNDKDAAMAFLNIMNMYDHSDGGAKEFANAVAYLALDPTTYLGLGVGSAAAKGVAKTVAKKELSMAIKTGLTASMGGLVEGATVVGGSDLAVQNIEQEARIREDIDLWRTGKAAAFGGALGMLLGGTIGWAGGKMVDNLNNAIQAEVRRQLPKTRTPQEIRDMTPDEFRELVEMQARISAGKPGEVDDMARIAMRYLIGEEGAPPDVPRDKSGAIDEEALIKILMDTPVGGDPMNTIADALEGAGYKIVRGEANELLFPLTALDDESIAILQRHAEDMDILIEGEAFPNNVEGFPEAGIPGDQVPITEYIMVSGSPQEMAEFAHRVRTNAPGPAPENVIPWERVEKLRQKQTPEATPVSREESAKLAQRIIEMDEIKAGDLMIAEAGRKGSTVVDELGAKYEVVGKTKNGWYRLIDKATGEERNMRRKQFEIFEPPPPTKAGVIELAPFDDTAARIIKLSEDISENPIQETRMTHRQVQSLVNDLQSMGLKIEEKGLFQYWDPTTMLWLRDTYNTQAHSILRLAKNLARKTEGGGKISDPELAFFNNAHAKFVATRDLFHGVSGNAARTLNILRARPHTDSYDVAASLIDSINLQGGRIQTERAIKAMAEAGNNEATTRVSQQIFGQKVASFIIQARYNMMLSSWRTHVKNVVGNTASGLWEGIIVNPFRFGVNNAWHLGKVAYSHIPGVKYVPNAADRITLANLGSEVRGMFDGTSDAIALAMRIAKGEELGEGKVWNELGLRYNVMDVPKGMWGKMGTTPVRLLEAGDAFFKHQYYNMKLRGLAEREANADAILQKEGVSIFSKEFREYKNKRFNEILDNPTSAMEREAKAWAAKLTYTNDPSVYGGVFAGLAKMAQTAQSAHPFFQALIPFVRTPANLLSYSMEMTGMNVITSPVKSFQTAMMGTAAERQEMVTRLLAATGLIMWIRGKWENGQVTGAGPPNFEERKAQEAAGWRANSIQLFGSDWVEVQGIQPAGQALTQIATIFDYMEMNDTERPPTEWLMGLVLTVADQVKDESYLSQISELVVAIDAKKEGRTQSVTASVASSFLIPNVVRDFRRPSDAQVRTIASTSILDQIGKSMINALPWLSDKLPPRRDWRGRPVTYYGNVYMRALIPFNMHDADDQDPASMALAYAQIPLSTPDRVMASPGRWARGINLMEMDEGEGYVYDKYVQLVGQERAKMVDKLIAHPRWKQLAADDNIGPGSEGDAALRAAVAIGSRAGRLKMLEFLMANDRFTRENGNTVLIHHPITAEEYRELYRDVRLENVAVPEDKSQYEFEERREGPRFFAPE